MPVVDGARGGLRVLPVALLAWRSLRCRPQAVPPTPSLGWRGFGSGRASARQGAALIGMALLASGLRSNQIEVPAADARGLEARLSQPCAQLKTRAPTPAQAATDGHELECPPWRASFAAQSSTHQHSTGVIPHGQQDQNRSRSSRHPQGPAACWRLDGRRPFGPKKQPGAWCSHAQQEEPWQAS